MSALLPPQPWLSVVMPVRNAGPYLDAAVASIVNQTFTEFEFVIVDDASTDGTWPALEAWAARDPRIVIVRNPTRLGMVGNANAAVRCSRGVLVARMDGDDVSAPERLGRQVDVLQSRPEVAVVGSLFIGIDGAGRAVRPRDRWRLLQHSPFHPFPHGSAMFRRDAFEAVGGYRDVDDLPEDADLFRRLAQHGTVVTLPDALYAYRYHAGNATTALGNGASVSRPRVRTDRMASQAVRLWAGGAPTLPDQPSGQAAQMRWTVRRLVYATWGRTHPPSLRTALRAWIMWRDAVASLAVRSADVVPWRGAPLPRVPAGQVVGAEPGEQRDDGGGGEHDTGHERDGQRRHPGRDHGHCRAGERRGPGPTEEAGHARV